MTELRPTTHPVTAEAIVELWEDGHFIAAIYPIESGVKIISKYFDFDRPTDALFEIDPPTLCIDPAFPPALRVHIWDRVPLEPAILIGYDEGIIDPNGVL